MTDLMYTIGAKFDGADEVNKSLQNIDRSADSTVKAIKRFDQEMKRAEAAQKKKTLTAQGYTKAKEEAIQRLMSYGVASDRATQSVERNTAAMQRGQRVTLQTGSAQQALRQRFLETANSIAILDGPLGGVASRFSAFGVLVGRTGIAVAGFLTALTALSFASRAGIREFAAYETQLLTLESQLARTGNQVNLTARDVMRFSEGLALSTLFDERDIASVASRILNFRNVTTDSFKDILSAAADMSASGFGNLESQALKLARALEDPRRSLRELRRDGIQLTNQQIELASSLAEVGRQSEAFDIVLGAVNKTVGGAAEAQASKSLAADFDTIGQSFRRFIREGGRVIAEDFGFSQLINRIAQDFAEAAKKLDEQDALTKNEKKLAELNARGRELLETLQELGNQAPPELLIEAKNLPDLIAATKEAVAFDKAMSEIESRRGTISNFSEAISNLESELSMREDMLGLSEREVEVRKILRDLGLSEGAYENVRDQIDALQVSLEAAGFSTEQIFNETQGLLDILGLVGGAYERVGAALDRIDASAFIRQQTSSLERQNELLSTQFSLMQNEGLSANEARVRAEEEILRNKIEQLRTQGENVGQLEALLNTSNKYRDNISEISELQKDLAEDERRLKTLEDELAILFRQLDLMEDGVREVDARRQAEVEINRLQLIRQRNLLDEKVALETITAEELNRLAVINAQLEAMRTKEAVEANIREVGRSQTSGDGGGGADQSERERERLEKEIEAMRLRFEIMQGFMSEEIQAQLIHFQEQDRLLDEALQMGILKREEHYRLQELLKEEHEKTMADIARQNRMAEIGGFSSFMGSMASIAQAGGSRLEKISRAFAAAQAISNAFSMAVGAGAQTPGPIWVRLAAYASALSTGLGAVAAIRGGRTSASSSTAVSRSAANVAVPSSQTQMAPQRVLIQGLDPNALFTGEQIQNLFESLYNENENRGRVFVVQT